MDSPFPSFSLIEVPIVLVVIFHICLATSSSVAVSEALSMASVTIRYKGYVAPKIVEVCSVLKVILHIDSI